MKRMLILVSIFVITTCNLFAWRWPSNKLKTPKYEAGKTSSDVSLSTTTFNYMLTKMSFKSVGGDTVVTSSMSTTNAYFLSGDEYQTIEFYDPILWEDTGKLITLDLDAGATCYYILEGYSD